MAREKEFLLPPLPDMDDLVMPTVEDNTFYEATAEEDERVFQTMPQSRVTRRGFRSPMVNIKARVKGNKLVLTIDLSKTYGVPEGRRNLRVATSRGVKTVMSPKHPFTFFILNMWRYPPKGEVPKL